MGACFGPIPEEEIISKIESSKLSSRKDVQELVRSLRGLSNWSEEIRSTIRSKAIELGIPLTRVEEFYESKLDLIAIDTGTSETIASPSEKLETIMRYKCVITVWSVETADGRVLDVCKTVDGASEMLAAVRLFAKLADDPGFAEEPSASSAGRKRKFLRMLEASGEKPAFRVIATPPDEETALAIEMQYAHDTRAAFWSPAPGQLSSYAEPADAII